MKWIRTRKKLPPPNVDVLAYRGRSAEMAFVYMDDEGWWVGECGELVCGITHWLRLPALPVVESEVES